MGWLWYKLKLTDVEASELADDANYLTEPTSDNTIQYLLLNYKHKKKNENLRSK